MSKKRWLRIAVLVVLVFMISCSKSTKKEPITNHINGAWLVRILETNGEVIQIGTLHISGFTYNYQPILQSEVPMWMKERFPFINELSGSVRYDLENLPDENSQNIKDNAILTQLSFNEREEIFLIKVDKVREQFYFHAWMSEFQLYEISKSYED